MKFVIHTQFLENYGAHCEDGKFSSGNAYWKMKGGDTYVVCGLDRVQDAVAFVAAKCMTNNLHAKEFPIEWETEEEWIAKLMDLDEDYRQFLLESAIVVDPQHREKEIKGWTEQYRVVGDGFWGDSDGFWAEN